MVGTVGFRMFVLGRVASADVTLRIRVAGVGLFGAFLILPALAGRLFYQLRAFRDPYAPLSEDLSILVRSTTWGRAWTVQVVAAVVALMAFSAVRRLSKTPEMVWAVAMLAAVTLAVTPAFSGHAFGSERLAGAAVAADGLHVLAAGCWVGGLAVLLVLARGGGSFAELVETFSPMALVCGATIVATGLFGAWLHIPSLGSLVTSTYGRLLLAKLLVVALVFGMGAFNWKRVRPGLGESHGRGLLRKTGGFEFLLMQVVLLVTAFFVGTPPP